MTRNVSEKILRVSAIVAMFAQSIFSPITLHAEKSYVWSITDNNPEHKPFITSIETNSNTTFESTETDSDTASNSSTPPNSPNSLNSSTLRVISNGDDIDLYDSEEWDIDLYETEETEDDHFEIPTPDVYQSEDLSDIDWMLDLEAPKQSKITTKPIHNISRTSPSPTIQQSLISSFNKTHEIAQRDESPKKQDTPSNYLPPTGEVDDTPKTILINFNNVSIIEYIRFISRLTNRNFIFDEQELKFNVTIVSEEPTSLENVMTALIQELRIRDLHLIEEGNNFIIHKNPDVRGISRVSVDNILSNNNTNTTNGRISELVTQVFRLNTLTPSRAVTVITPLLSTSALIETSDETQQLIITDLVTNIEKVATLLKSIDAPDSGLVIGQYVVRNTLIDQLIELAQNVMEPIQGEQTLNFIPHPAAKSVFIVSSPFLVERAISILQHLDSAQGATRIYNLEDLKYQQGKKEAEQPEIPDGKWEVDGGGRWIFRPGFPTGVTQDSEYYPKGRWMIDKDGNWYFNPDGTISSFIRSGEVPKGLEKLGKEQPVGRWTLEPEGAWVFQLAPGQSLQPKSIKRRGSYNEELPAGHIERIQFYIHKLQFRKGTDIVDALQRIGDALDQTGVANRDLVLSIQSAQWLETNNSMVFTGTETAIEKVKDLIEEIDKPTRQVFIEMLILETTIDDSLTYGVSWATRSGGGSTSTAQAYLGSANPLSGAINGAGGVTPIQPDTSKLATAIGYHLGIIGQRLTHNGTQFATLGALVTALHQRGDTNIVMNPKIIAEDNKTAEIFVGINTRYQTDSVSNDQGSIITTNYEYRDVGTTLSVTPIIGNNDVITLEIAQEVSRVGDQGNTGGGTNVSDLTTGPTTSINRTNTTVHIPDKHFVIISGMMNDEKTRTRNQFPCLGGIPILGGAFSEKDNTDVKRNLMIFIRPQIIDTGAEYTQLTKKEQEIYKQKNRSKKTWKYQVDEGLDFLNIKTSCCDECN